MAQVLESVGSVYVAASAAATPCENLQCLEEIEVDAGRPPHCVVEQDWRITILRLASVAGSGSGVPSGCGSGLGGGSGRRVGSLGSGNGRGCGSGWGMVIDNLY
jgi:hypothetical protein